MSGRSSEYRDHEAWLPPPLLHIASARDETSFPVLDVDAGVRRSPRRSKVTWFSEFEIRAKYGAGNVSGTVRRVGSELIGFLCDAL
jgi:hypothetical protein